MKLTLIAAVVAAAGLTAGVVAGNLTGEDTAGATVTTALVLDCPAGDTIDSYSSGSRVFAIARSDDATWVQVRQLDFPDSLVWIAAGDVDLDDDIDALPVAGCGEFDSAVIAAGVSTSTTIPSSTTTSIPGSTTTTVAGTTTSTGGTTSSTSSPPPPPPPPTTTTTPPDTTKPSMPAVSALPNKIWEGSPNQCSDFDKVALISATVTDAGSGVAGVTASWVIEGDAPTIPLDRIGNQYSGDFGPFSEGTIQGDDEIIDITVRAIDNAGNAEQRVVQVRLHSAGTCNP